VGDRGGVLERKTAGEAGLIARRVAARVVIAAVGIDRLAVG
jgi:hypothetical protein